MVIVILIIHISPRVDNLTEVLAVSACSLCVIVLPK